MKRFLLFFAWAALLSAGSVTHLIHNGTINPAVEPVLEQLPDQFGALQRGTRYEVDPLALGSLPPDLFLFEQLIAPSGAAGNFYLAYFKRGKRWSGYPHHVDVCFRAIGWEDLQARRLQTASGGWIRIHEFERQGEQVKVAHWQQRPSLTPGEEGPSALVGRLGGPDGLRQDVASIYFEFPLGNAPSDADLVLAAEALMSSLEEAWAR